MYLLKIPLILLVSLIFIAPAKPQFLTLENERVKYDKDQRPCIGVRLDPGTDEVKEAWEDYIKDKYDVKLKGHGFLTNKDVLKAEDVKFEAISDKNLNFYTRVVEENDQTSMCVFASLGYDIYINQINYAREYHAMRGIVVDFLNGYLPKFYEDEIKETRKELDDLVDERKDMQEELKENEKEIRKLKERNEKLSNNLVDAREKIAAREALLKDKEIRFERVKDQLNSMSRRQ